MIGYLDVVSVGLLPSEAKAPLIVDPEAVLATAIPGQLLQIVAGYCRKRRQSG